MTASPPTPAFTTLISADALRALMATPAGANIVIVDTSFDLADVTAGERNWRDAHLPGARYLNLDTDLSGARSRADGSFRGRHPLPERAAFALTLARCGITPATQVVAVDRQGGMVAARLWWMLRWMGHAQVALLDGGVAAWTASGGALVSEPVGEVDVKTRAAPAAPAYPQRPPLTTTVSADELAAALIEKQSPVQLIDARAPERFRGDVEPLDAAAGHIPGAKNRFFKDNLASDGRFKPAAVLRAEFDALLGAPATPEAAVPAGVRAAASSVVRSVVHQCGSGVSACHNLLAMEHAGLPGAALYPGSWSEWSADPSRAVARGG